MMILGIFILMNMSLVVSEEDVMKSELTEKSTDWNKSMAKEFDCSYKAKMMKSPDNYKYAYKTGYNRGYGMVGYGLLKLVYIAVGAFIVSLIFWLTRNWLVKNRK